MKTSLILDSFALNPKRLFLLDGLGALLSAFFLGVLLANFEEMFGMPPNVLYRLSLLACVLAVYSLCCSFFAVGKWSLLLRVIAIANLLYCCLTIGCLVVFSRHLTLLGIVYFVLEVMVIGVLITIELKGASSVSGRKS